MAGIRLSSILFAISISSVILCYSVFQACSKRLKACESVNDNSNLNGLILSLTDKVELLETRVTDLQAQKRKLFEQEYLRLAAVKYEGEGVASASQCVYDEGRRL
jgi:hypothetical protein